MGPPIFLHGRQQGDDEEHQIGADRAREQPPPVASVQGDPGDRSGVNDEAEAQIEGGPFENSADVWLSQKLLHLRRKDVGIAVDPHQQQWFRQGVGDEEGGGGDGAEDYRFEFEVERVVEFDRQPSKKQDEAHGEDREFVNLTEAIQAVPQLQRGGTQSADDRIAHVAEAVDDYEDDQGNGV